MIKKIGLHSIPAKFGSKATLFISSFCHILAVLFWLLFVWEVWGVALGKIALIGVIISGIILALEHKIVHKNFAHIDRAFFYSKWLFKYYLFYFYLD